MLRQREVRRWFAGEDVYGQFTNAVYPPASYLLLWPIGWFGLAVTRWLWAGMTALLLAVLLPLFARCGLGDDAVQRRAPERRLLACLPLALYPVGATVGNGQLGLAVTLCLMATFWLWQAGSSWRNDLAVAGLFLLALVKPSMAAFFFWIVAFASGARLRGVLVVAGYALLTLVSSWFQSASVVELMLAWSTRGVRGAKWGATHGEGSIRIAEEAMGEPVLQIVHLNLHSLLGVFGRKDLLASATFTVLFLLGAWVLVHRKCSVWVLAGVTAIVARFAMYHGWYDDVVMLLPLIALYRHASGVDSTRAGRRTAGLLFTGMVLSLVAPGGLYLLPHPWNNAYVIAQAALWSLALLFLVVEAWRTMAGARPAPAA